MWINIRTLLIKTIVVIFLFFSMNNLSANETVLNPVNEEPPNAEELIFRNRSILKCGTAPDETIFTLLDVQALLAISNFILNTPIRLTTDWNNFDVPKINLYKLSDETPEDVLWILFLCLNWEDTRSTHLSIVTEEELLKYLTKIKKNPPWKTYPKETQKKLYDFSDKTLKEFIDIVLSGERSQSVRGTLKTNQSLKSVKFSWLL